MVNSILFIFPRLIAFLISDLIKNFTLMNENLDKCYTVTLFFQHFSTIEINADRTQQMGDD